MKRSLLITLAVLLTAGHAFAAGGNVGLFVNPTAANCAIMQGASTTTIAVVHKNHTGSTAVGFSAPLPPCGQVGLVWISDQNPGGYVIIPNDTLGSQSGISVGYGSCRAAGEATHVINMLFNRTALLPGCCLYTVKANLELAQNVISADCSPNPIEEIANGTSANVRPTGTTAPTCPCNIPNEASTWGVIKELFRQGS
jgi:hypothetical protein